MSTLVEKSSLSSIEINTINAYDEIALIIDEYEEDLRNGHHLERFEWYLKQEPKQLGEAIIDIGCGSGRALNVLKEIGAKKYVGADASAKMIEIARKRFPTDFFHVADFYSLPKLFLKNQFRYFFASGCLHHVPKEKMNLALGAIREIIEPGGYGFITLPLGSDTTETHNVLGHELSQPLIGYEWGDEEFRTKMKESGFAIVDPHTCYNCGIITDIVQKL